MDINFGGKGNRHPALFPELLRPCYGDPPAKAKPYIISFSPIRSHHHKISSSKTKHHPLVSDLLVQICPATE